MTQTIVEEYESLENLTLGDRQEAAITVLCVHRRGTNDTLLLTATVDISEPAELPAAQESHDALEINKRLLVMRRTFRLPAREGLQWYLSCRSRSELPPLPGIDLPIGIPRLSDFPRWPNVGVVTTRVPMSSLEEFAARNASLISLQPSWPRELLSGEDFEALLEPL